MSLQAHIRQGVSTLGLTLPEQAIAQLDAYIQLLTRWNRAYNLTAVRDPQEMVVKHLLDSLAILPWVNNSPLLDVGSGAGLPGVPLAIARPELNVTLLDGSSKRVRFQQQAITELGLCNVTAVWSRVEDYQPEQPFKQVVSRAFSALDEMARLCRHLCAENGVLLAMKGLYPDAEIAALDDGYQVIGSEALHVPGLGAERHLIRLQRVG